MQKLAARSAERTCIRFPDPSRTDRYFKLAQRAFCPRSCNALARCRSFSFPQYWPVRLPALVSFHLADVRYRYQICRKLRMSWESCQIICMTIYGWMRSLVFMAELAQIEIEGALRRPAKRLKVTITTARRTASHRMAPGTSSRVASSGTTHGRRTSQLPDGGAPDRIAIRQINARVTRNKGDVRQTGDGCRCVPSATAATKQALSSVVVAVGGRSNRPGCFAGRRR